MIVLNAYCRLLPDKVEEFSAASIKNMTLALQEEGCERFDFYRSAADPIKYVFVEEWTTRKHLDAHFATAHFGEFMTAVESCLSAEPEIRIFEAKLEE